MATELDVFSDSMGSEIRDVLKEICEKMDGGSSSGVKSLDDMTWEEVGQVCKDGKAESTFHIGQTKRTVINGENVTVRIIGFNHDTLTTADSDYNNGIGRAAITWEMVDCLKDWYVMNTSSTNVGGWKDCYMRNTTLANIYNNLDSDLKGVIRAVDKKSGQGNATDAIDTTSDNLFLLSAEEVWGTYYLYFNGSSWVQYSSKGEGYQYEFYQQFDDSAKNGVNSYGYDRNGNGHTRYYTYPQQFNAIKFLGDHGTSYGYPWLRSPNVTSTYLFLCVYYYGYYYNYYADYISGLSACFCT